jgi:periplasmic glucans biosynthesis protein
MRSRQVEIFAAASAIVACAGACRDAKTAREPLAPASRHTVEPERAPGADSVRPAAQDPAFIAAIKDAQALLDHPHDDRTTPLPESLRELDYDAYRDIRFRPARAWWQKDGLPYQLQFFHPGFLFPRTVRLTEWVDGAERPIEFAPELFDYGRNQAPAAHGDIGFAGLRVHTRLNRPDYFDELAVFLGATYYRLLGRGQIYGASARGIAIDVAAAEAEEFPFFRRLWVKRPQAEAKELSVYALMDGKSVTGAYRFVLAPGAPTTADVDAALFFRRTPAKLGVAPLTSMFLFGESTPGRFDDYRPEVHDSDGLLIHGASGEWLFRPLQNPSKVAVSAFALESPRGFGLVQRDRVFDHYSDLEAHYERRPSLFVAPRGDWGKGHVELVEIPSDRETHDNVVVSWVPAQPPAAGARLDFAYRVEAALYDGSESPRGRAMATRIALVDPLKPPFKPDPRRARFLVDFAGDNLAALGPKPAVEGVVSVGGGRVIGPIGVERTPVAGTLRAQFTVRRDADQPVELRAFLRHGADTLTETWSYRWEQPEPRSAGTP